MKKKKFLTFLTLAFTAGLVLASCDGTSTEGEDSGEESISEDINITSVTIVDEDGYAPETEVLDNYGFQLSANVVSNSSATSARRVDWTVDNEDIATVQNGYVTVNNLGKGGTATFTVTATSRVDETKSDSVTFDVTHSPIDLVSSKPYGYIVSYDYLDTGVFYVTEAIDTGLIFSDIYDTKWYAEVEFRITAVDPSDGYPKIGLMTGTDDLAAWNNGDDPTVFYFVDAQTSLQDNMNSMGFVNSNSLVNNWDWDNAQYTTVSEASSMRTWMKFGLLRDGVTYTLFYGCASDNYATFGKINSYTSTAIAADTPSYVWFGGFAAATDTRNYVSYVGDEVNEYFAEPTSIEFTTSQYLLFPGESYATSLTSDSDYLDLSKITYTSSNPEIVTVDENGVATVASTYTDNYESVTITATYNALDGSTSVYDTMTIVATNDDDYKATVDGIMDDAGYTSSVMENSYTLSYDASNYIIVYAYTHINGVYLYVDHYVSSLFPTTNTDWWLNENFEIKLGTMDNLVSSGQIYVSTLSGGTSNVNGLGGSYAIVDNGLDNQTSLYNHNFELFVPYTAIANGVSDGSNIFFTIGFRSSMGWASCAWWEGSDYTQYLALTAIGFVSGSSLF